MISKVWQTFRSLLPPCAECGVEGSAELLCTPCFNHLQISHPQRIAGREVFVSFPYRGGIKDWILDIKENSRPERWRELVEKFLPEKLRQNADRYDAIVPAAADPVLTRQRRFDSSLLFARRIGKILDLPVLENVFERLPFLQSQKELSRDWRRKYLKQTLRLNANFEWDPTWKLLWVDDVVTTGATLEAHEALLGSKVDELNFYSLSRA